MWWQILWSIFQRKKNIIFIDNKPSKDNVNKMYKQNWGDYLFSLNIWGVDLIYDICMWDMFFKKRINEKILKISCFQYYTIVYFWIIWWCYSLLLDYYFALLSILVQKQKKFNFWIFFNPFCFFFVCAQSYLFVIHVRIIATSCWFPLMFNNVIIIYYR